MAFACHSLILELAYRSCLRREADAYLVELAAVSCVWQGIALVVYLLKGGRGCAVELELEDVDVAGTFEHTVYAALARLLLHVGVVLAKELHDEVERVLEVTLTLLLVLLALEAVGYVGEHGGELEAEGVEVASLQGVADTVQPCGLVRLTTEVVGGEQYHDATAVLGRILGYCSIHISTSSLPMAFTSFMIKDSRSFDGFFVPLMY